jgi:hypothetical protein
MIFPILQLQLMKTAGKSGAGSIVGIKECRHKDRVGRKTDAQVLRWYLFFYLLGPYADIP